MLQDVILPGRRRVVLPSSPLHGHCPLLCVGILGGRGLAGGQCQQGVGPVQETVPPQETEAIPVALFAHLSKHQGLRREQGLGEAVEVAQVELDAGVGDSELVDVGGTVLRADVTLAREGGHRDGVLELIERQVVRDAAVHIAHALEGRGDEAAVHGDEGAADIGLDKLLFGIEVGYNDVLAIRDAGQRDA